MAIEWAKRGCETEEGNWITAEDKLLSIKEMSTEHIQHCIDYIRTFGGQLREYELEKIYELEGELSNRENVKRI